MFKRETRPPSNANHPRAGEARVPGCPEGCAGLPAWTGGRGTEALGRGAEERSHLLLEHGLVGVYCTTIDGRILDCNETLVAMLGYESRQELLAHQASDLYLTLEDRDVFLARLRKTGALANSELCLRHKDGTPIHILENVILVPDDHGTPSIIQGTMVDITERKRTEESRRESEQRYRVLAGDLRRVMQRLQTVREEERARIARELHDELGQALTALNMDLHWLKGRSWHEPEATRTRIQSMGDLLHTTLEAIGRICSDLRPSILDDFGLSATIEWQVREFEARTGIRCRVSCPAVLPTLHNEQMTAVFRIFQESLTNIARHARATEAEVTLGATPDTLVLTVADNGSGIAQEEAAGANSVGLIGMRERALRWGGQVDISGTAGRGTTVTLRMPVEDDGVEPEP